MTAQILVVEDDEYIGRNVHAALTVQGYDSRLARSTAEAEAAVEARVPDVVLLDLGLPDGDGIDLARRLRLAHPGLIIVVITARGEELDVIAGFDAGADDYLTKPFRLSEVFARLRAHLRRIRPPEEMDRRPLQMGSLTVDRTARQVWVSGAAIDLRPKEYDLLVALADRAGQAVSRADLMTQVWDQTWWSSTKTLDVTIASLRQHLDAGAEPPAESTAPRITTLRGFGYRLEVIEP